MNRHRFQLKDLWNIPRWEDLLEARPMGGAMVGEREAMTT
jgi:hypothetical protein